MDLKQVTREIVELHVAFEEWLCGTSDSLERVESALDPDFFFAGTEGGVVSRAGVLDFLRTGRGQSSAKIDIEDVEMRWTRADLCSATYVEVHRTGDDDTRRRSTGVFERSDTAPAGLVWLSVHETWMS